MKRKQKMYNEDRMNASFRITQYLYRKACKELRFEAFKHAYNGGMYIVDVTLEKKALVGDLYLKYILQCSNSTLQTILDAHEHKIVNRSQRTLDAIKNELLERVLYEEM